MTPAPPRPEVLFRRAKAIIRRAKSLAQPEAVRLYRAAAEAGHVDAMWELGWHLVHGEGVRWNSAEGNRWLRRAIRGGNIDALYSLGVSYSHGRGVPRSKKKAFQYYLRAAQKGHADAQHNIGYYLLFGIAGRKDPKAAVEWFSRSGLRGSLKSVNMLGYCWYRGLGVKMPHAGVAVDFYRQAARKGLPLAQYNLALHYWDGTGTLESLSLCKKWLARAAAGGHRGAARLLKELSSPDS